MRYTDDPRFLHPQDDNLEFLTAPYEFKAREYSDAYMFHQILGCKRPLLNYSDIFEDATIYRGHPEIWWTVFFDAMPKDADKLMAIMNRFPSSKYGDCMILEVLPWGQEGSVC